MFEIGSSLREARTRQGLDINEMELRTKVRAKYLRALEDERFDLLPGHSYVKGFLRTYADKLGLDGQLYVDEYNSRYVAGDEETPLRARRSAGPVGGRQRRARRESRLVLVTLVGIALVTALVIAAWRFGGPDDPRVTGLAPAAAKPASTARRATIEVRAVGGSSFVQVRAGSRAGNPLYTGTLERGQTQRFQLVSLYLAVTSPRNVVVRVNGNRVALPPGRAYVVTARGVRAAPST
jgi:hypothetical protein